MAPPKIIKVQCYLYRDTDTKMWTAESKDLTGCKATCIQPEDTLRRIQSIALERLAERMMLEDLSNNLQIDISVTIVTEEEAKRLIGIPPSHFDSDYEDP